MLGRKFERLYGTVQGDMTPLQCYNITTTGTAAGAAVAGLWCLALPCCCAAVGSLTRDEIQDGANEQVRAAQASAVGNNPVVVQPTLAQKVAGFVVGSNAVVTAPVSRLASSDHPAGQNETTTMDQYGNVMLMCSAGCAALASVPAAPVDPTTACFMAGVFCCGAMQAQTEAIVGRDPHFPERVTAGSLSILADVIQGAVLTLARADRAVGRGHEHTR